MLRNVPCRMARWVMMLNQISTWLSQECIGGGVVQVEARAGGEPAADGGVLVRGVVVDDQMDADASRWRKNWQELLVPMTRLALGEHLARGDVQRLEQRGGPVSDVIVRHPLDIPQAPTGGAAGVRSRPEFDHLVNTQDERVGRRVEIQPDDIAHLLHEERIGGQLEVFLVMRLEAEGRPDAMDGGLR